MQFFGIEEARVGDMFVKPRKAKVHFDSEGWLQAGHKAHGESADAHPDQCPKRVHGMGMARTEGRLGRFGSKEDARQASPCPKEAEGRAARCTLQRDPLRLPPSHCTPQNSDVMSSLQLEIWAQIRDPCARHHQGA